jgi:plastocyanin
MPTRHIVIVDHMAFTPDTLWIEEGDCVQWQFREAGHSVVSDALHPNVPSTRLSGMPLFDSGLQPVGGVFEHTFGGTEVYPYHCGPMPEMKGCVTVAAP